MDAPFELLVSLWAQPGRESALSEYEDAVLAFLDDHGASVVVRVRRTEPGPGPFETQLLRFPSEAALEEFVANPGRVALAATRDAVIARTEMTRVEAI